MITKDEIIKIVEEYISETDYFLVEVCVSADNRIVVEIDSFEGVDIDFCANLSKKIEENFDREKEDFELEVSSAGLTSPFKVSQQYEKNLGNEVEVLTKNGEKLTGILTETNENNFTITVEVKEKLESEKRKTLVQKHLNFEKNDIKYIKYLIRFK
ncbi:MAG: ribosome assembly cofactor RimP [Paludibacteraceae bacterium]|nr:ribosome assembly cofactor RimP [Paludibacteraceae bacterium]